jgi:dolichol kinase
MNTVAVIVNIVFVIIFAGIVFRIGSRKKDPKHIEDKIRKHDKKFLRKEKHIRRSYAASIIMFLFSLVPLLYYSLEKKEPDDLLVACLFSIILWMACTTLCGERIKHIRSIHLYQKEINELKKGL